MRVKLKYSLTEYGKERVVERIEITNKQGARFAYYYGLNIDDTQAQALLFSIDVIALHNPNRCSNDYYMKKKLWLMLLNWYRSKYKRMKFTEKCSTCLVDTYDLHDDFKRIDILEIIGEAPLKYQPILIDYIKGKNKSEISRERGISKSWISVIINKSIEQIRNRMEITL